MQRYHVIIDIEKVSADRLTDKEGLRSFLQSFPEKIGMHVLVPPVLADGISENPGISGFVIIDYSHISIHTFTRTGLAMVDIFSCKPYEQHVAIELVLKLFNANTSQAAIKEVFWG